jgi:uncharacterized protein (DUF1684 family)
MASLVRRGFSPTVAVVFALGASCSPPPPDEGNYVETQLEDRQFKDEFFSSGPACSDTGSLDCSPVPLDRRHWMLPLRYYDVDPTYRIPAQLRLEEERRDETYAAGRYLDLHVTPTGIYDLDFNRAYHPYCYYDEMYECPFPPPENRLPVPILAGEKLPPEEERQISVDVPEPPAAIDPAS